MSFRKTWRWHPVPISRVLARHQDLERGRRGQGRKAALRLLHGAPAAVEPDGPIKSAELAKPIETARRRRPGQIKQEQREPLRGFTGCAPRHSENAEDKKSAAHNGKAATGNGANTGSYRSVQTGRDDHRLLIEVRAVLRQIGELGRSE